MKDSNKADSDNNKINIFHKLRDKKSNGVITSLYNFINNQVDDIIKNEKVNDVSTIIQDYISSITIDFTKLWNLDYPSDQNYVETVEGFEYLITKSVYPKLMNLFQDDAAFDKVVKRFSFVTLKHLDLDIFFDEFDLAGQLKQLTEINHYKAPKEKACLIVNYCNYLSCKYPKLDTVKFVKLLAFTLLKANIPCLKLNIRFILAFRNKTVVSNEESYFLLQITKAIEFIQSLQEEENKLLNINKKDYSILVEENEKKDLFLITDKKKDKGIFVYKIR
jgi:hypothetical protein